MNLEPNVRSAFRTLPGALLRSLIFERITPIGRSSSDLFFCAFMLRA